MRSVTLALLAGALMIGVGAQAADKPLSEADVKAKLEAAGYTNVHDVEREGKHFDADATKDGKEIHLHVNATTGAITPSPNEDEEHEKHEKHEKDHG